MCWVHVFASLVTVCSVLALDGGASRAGRPCRAGDVCRPNIHRQKTVVTGKWRARDLVTLAMNIVRNIDGATPV